MSILIKGMEMPEHGGDSLRIEIRPNGQVLIDKRTFWVEAYAVELPPHGDLIDRDAYSREMRKRQDACAERLSKISECKEPELYHRVNGTYLAFVKAKLTLDDIPVVIPAEGVEE